ncbi:SGNH/GDSL hydrolase family protein [Lactococcus lactis]|uniref:Lysophospholipase L1 and related esterases n=1 Tax=Lactococcus lactis subsp. lactis TaxID=1360 RepID=A0A0B8R150_LACLL|nr:SGNH/GDSL hydrolase family protein [Lactococcus lactis]MDN6197963.1 SGNH/GDSL hydrolase family protein [Lactococcus raffinolactis]KST82415.1 putative secreted protein [Lactococcus lactis subsp. lactis]MBU3886137.1 SGNH/GDSL hydrolase family protein [Lactococcus lactis]MCT3119807.1 SGNH/GDSL hydrolase family protein [Lactococcus lactis]MDX6024372.1 SGNH/GDSL hydrolase family protein [Lactococcus lactis subsp. lactis]
MNNRVRKRKSRQPRIFKFGFGLILVVIVVLIGLLAYEKIHSSVPSGKVTSLNAVKHDKTSSWVSTWAASPVDMGNHKYTGTIRNMLVTTVAGDSLRVNFTNAFGDSDLQVEDAYIAIADAKGNVIGQSVPITFNGKSTTTISQGKELLSDTIKLTVPARTRLAVTFYTPKAIEQTGHWLANETSYITIGTKKTRSPDTKGWIDTPGWWFIDSIDVQASEGGATKTIVALGDSLTDGFYSTNEGRYTDTLMNRLNSQNGNEWSLVNEGITGNQVLTDSPTNVAKNAYFGQSALSRLDRDVFNRPGLKDILLLEGINDINTGASANKIIEGYKKIINQAHISGVQIIAGTLPPFKGYPTWTAKKDKVRQKVNHWILTSGAFDGTVDFAKVLATSGNSEELNPIYDSGDHLHPNNAGYKAMGDAVNLSLFK